MGPNFIIIKLKITWKGQIVTSLPRVTCVADATVGRSEAEMDHSPAPTRDEMTPAERAAPVFFITREKR